LLRTIARTNAILLYFWKPGVARPLHFMKLETLEVIRSESLLAEGERVSIWKLPEVEATLAAAGMAP
jgi:hypothetical protein